jgi:hypothetical protein
VAIEKSSPSSAQAKALDKLPPKLRSTANGIRNKLEKANTHYLQMVHEIGEDVVEVQDEKSGKYGPDPVGLMTVALEFEERGFLVKAARFHRLVPDSVLTWLTDSRSKAANRPITWGHVTAILGVDQSGCTAAQMRAKFKEYAKMVFDEDLSIIELTARVRRDLRDGKPGAGGGRPLAIPTHLTGKLENLANILGTLVRNHHQIWSHPKHGFTQTIADMPAAHINETVLASLLARRDLAREAAVALAAELDSLDLAYAMACRKAGVPVHGDATPLALAMTAGEIVVDVPSPEAE